MSNKYPLLIIILSFLTGFSNAQTKIGKSQLHLSGKIYDALSHTSLPAASVSVKGTTTGVLSDKNGRYELNINPGSVHIYCEYIGYTSLDTVVLITGDTQLNLYLKPASQSLNQVNIKGAAAVQKEIATQNLTVLQGSDLDRTRGLSLGDALKSITGVTTFQTGPSIAKPVIHGLTGTRVLILNNGVTLQAQQWGQEHAPEIDPFIANQIEVIKGAAGIRYGADAIAGVVSVNPKLLPTDTGTMDAEVNAVGMTNSRLGAFSAMLEGALGKNLAGWSYRIQGTYKRAGNTSTPDYILGNTGLSENDFSAALQYHHKNYGVDAYYSDFDTKLGIEYDTEVGSISDLEMRIAEGGPVTTYSFSYFIDRPYQLVNHATAKVRGFYNFGDSSKVDIQYAYQQNTRKEYEELSFSPSLDPALYLQIHTSTIDVNWEHKDGSGFSGSEGLSGMNQGNIRMYEYLIPNYVDYDGGAYAIERYKHNKLLLEAGVRYDYRWLRAFAFDATAAKIDVTTTHYSGNSATLGATYNFTDDLKLTGNYSAAFRPPSINELYIDGVHQSIGEFEVGDPNLKTERANDFSLNLNYATSWLAVDVEGYYNRINNFIFEEPTGTYYHAPSGALLEFNYTQANVYFRGVDLGFTIKPLDSLEINSKSSLIYAWNETINNYLIYTPPMRLQNGFTYHLGKIGVFRNVSVGAENVYVARQTDVPAGYDFEPPPGAYSLFNAHIGFKLIINKTPADFDIAANNLTNVAYKDYLDRFRYFADEPGRNIIFRLRVPFKILTKNKESINN
ncbi:TonB-dependent receptor [Mucilaginibacter sp. X4EP1]|uniref:TonB-dependent receptor n=1 Tax=Mucilaginibacter sp. X4EP1 TaxID=2723092 RepID=UPI0021680FB5|nr:TonB-dependent receptor [Mucilaginibacter sp. X4EP1]MCS3813412.1 iron complex outermembrane receptor protein [Mucilaginibacter sp. X4EP1]